MKSLFGERLRFDWKIAAVTVVSTLVVLADYYIRLTPSEGLDKFIYFLLVPLAVILFAFREDPRGYGFTLGDWKAGLAITSLAILLIAPVLWWAGRGAAMSAYYRPSLGGLPWTTFFDLLGWEFLFRGWLTFAYVRKFGPEGLWLQAVPFAVAHLTKPAVETLSTIFGGFAFGWVAWRTRSFLYPFLIHWFVASFTILVAAGALG
jgi:membrane protease YdiL (CAAX protease family)